MRVPELAAQVGAIEMKMSNWIERVGAIALPIVPALAMAQYWIVSLARGESLSVAAIYRHGDYNYFPLIAGLAHLGAGEPLVYEHLGEGIRSFLFPSLALHGLMVGLFGGAGFICADVLVAVFVFYATRRFLRATGLSEFMTAILALVVSCGLLDWPGHHLPQWIGWAPGMHLWGFRFPRPLLTDLFLLLCMGSWLRIVVQRQEAAGEWAGMGLWLSLLLQSGPYSGATVGLGIACTAPFLAFRREAGVARTLRGLACLASVATVIALPFAAQRLLEHPDVPIRFGLYSVDRMRPLFVDGFPGNLLGASLFAALVVACVRWSAVPRRLERLGAILLLALFLLLSGLALPVSTILLGKTIEPYHFGDELVTFKTLVLIVGAGQLCDVVGAVLRGRLAGAERLRSWLGPALVATVAVVCLVAASSRHRPWIERELHMRDDFAAYRVEGYREAFRELTRELASERHSGARVLATLDIQVLDWWSLFGGGQVFCPDPCATKITDDEIEARLLSLFRTLRASERDMLRLLHDRAVMIFFLGCAKYQASRGHSFAPFHDYPLAVRREAMRSSRLDSWLVALPYGEVKRLQERYSRTREVGDDLRLDLIVLGPGPLDSGLAPPPESFELVFTNERFRIYARSP